MGEDLPLDKPQGSAASSSQASLSGEELGRDIDLSDDEGLLPDQPAFLGLFRPHLSLLHKAKTTTQQGFIQTVPDPL